MAGWDVGMQNLHHCFLLGFFDVEMQPCMFSLGFLLMDYKSQPNKDNGLKLQKANKNYRWELQGLEIFWMTVFFMEYQIFFKFLFLIP